MSKVRYVHGGTEKHTQIITTGRMDRKFHAYHRYEIYRKSRYGRNGMDPFLVICLQYGHVQEVGVNGCSNEDLLAIVLDRLLCLQEGKFPCDENESAITAVKLALVYLNSRIADREKRGVEGQNKP